MLNLYPKNYLVKLSLVIVTFVLVITALCFILLLLFNISGLSSTKNNVDAENQAWQLEFIDEIDNLSFNNTSLVSKSILNLFDENIDIIDYKEPVREDLEYTTIFRHNLVISGYYEQILKGVFKLETKYPYIFLVNLSITTISDFKKLKGRHNEEETTKVVATLQFIHYSI